MLTLPGECTEPDHVSKDATMIHDSEAQKLLVMIRQQDYEGMNSLLRQCPRLLQDEMCCEALRLHKPITKVAITLSLDERHPACSCSPHQNIAHSGLEADFIDAVLCNKLAKTRQLLQQRPALINVYGMADYTYSVFIGTAIHLALYLYEEHGDEATMRMLELLLKWKPDLSLLARYVPGRKGNYTQSIDHLTPVITAIKYTNNIKIVKQLLHHGASVHAAVSKGSMKTRNNRIVIPFNLPLDAQRITPLFYAVIHDNIPLAILLLQHGAICDLFVPTQQDGTMMPLQAIASPLMKSILDCFNPAKHRCRTTIVVDNICTLLDLPTLA